MKALLSEGLPPIAARQLRWFAKYVGFYLSRNFHGIHLLRLTHIEQLEGWPLLVCLNHPSWWDPLMGVYLSQRFFAHRQQYSPIAAAGLAKYRLFERLGFFGIDPGARAGAQRFLHVGKEVLSRSDGAFWVTAQGHFTDVRSPMHIEPGSGHLASRIERFAMLPIALEYSFWNERYAEAFACMGEPLMVDAGRGRSPKEWTEQFASSLQSTQDTLSEHVKRRDPVAFEPLLTGSSGVGGVYDFWRALKSRAQGKKFRPEHGRI
ncbi:MAG: lysophospholipid acyltransferase family protein [Acidobacteriota bacterium]|nr:lysophospholipid acyltransferase family protein [Acidobacteriota bacterium]